MSCFSAHAQINNRKMRRKNHGQQSMFSHSHDLWSHSTANARYLNCPVILKSITTRGCDAVWYSSCARCENAKNPEHINNPVFISSRNVILSYENNRTAFLIAANNALEIMQPNVHKLHIGNQMNILFMFNWFLIIKSSKKEQKTG